MTDTGQIPGEGQPENAGGQPDGQQPDFAVNGSYPYAGPGTDGLVDLPAPGVSPVEADLLLPGSQGAWSDPQQGGPGGVQPQGQAEFAAQQDLYAQHLPYEQQESYGHLDPYAQQAQYVQQAEQMQQAAGQAVQQPTQQPVQQVAQQPQPAPDAPVTEEGPHAPGAQQYEPADSHVPGPHETDGRDSGAIDLGSVRADFPEGQTPAKGTPRSQTPPRRPLHLGPPEPAQSGAVRPLSDRGIRRPANGTARKGAQAQTVQQVQDSQAGRAQAQQPGTPQPEHQPQAQQPQAEVPAQQGESGPAQDAAATGSAPEYLDFTQGYPEDLPGPQLGALPPQDETWAANGHMPVEAEAPVQAPEEVMAFAGPRLASYAEQNAAPPATAPEHSVAAMPATPEAAVQQPEHSAQADAHAHVSANGSAVPDHGQDQGQGSDGGHGQAPDSTSAAPAEQAAAPRTGGRKRRRRAKDPESDQSSGTGNTWVSSPGSTAVEAIEPQQDGSGGQSADDVAAAPAADGTRIPAQQARHAEAPVVAEQPEASAAVPRQGQHGGTEAEAQQQPEAAAMPAPEPAAAAAPDHISEQATAPEPQADAAIEPVPAPGPEPEAAVEAAAVEAATPEAVTAEAGTAEAVTVEAVTTEAAATETGAVAPVATETGAEAPAQAEAAAETGNETATAPGTTAEVTPGPEAPAQPEAGTDAPAPPAAPAGPPAPGYADEEREAVHRLMRERRDIRNGFRPDPIPHEVLLRVLEAAHTAPSVGHSQPWDFVVIRSEETRRAMHELAERQRHAYAESLPKARAKQFKELKIEAILDTPVNIVVTADPTRGGRHTLGRHTQPQMAPYSSALAVENLWLAARAEGLGVGWVSFFDEREMVRALELPEHLEVVAYLCVGYVDEFPPEPELAQAGWSKRRPLSWVVHEESYGRRVLPGAEPQDLLSDTVAAIRPLDAKALGEAWERQKRMTKPAGALGMLEIISAQLCGLSRKCPPPLPEPAAVAIFAADHGVHAQGVTPWPQEVTSQMVANILGGGAVCNAFAGQVGAEVCVVDVGVASELPPTTGLLPRKVRAGTDDMTQGPAMSREEALRAVEVGIDTARDLVAAGNKALLTGEMGIANTTASAVLVAACTGADPSEVTGRGTGINDETHARKVEVVRRALEVHQPDPEDPLGMLAAVGGLEHAALVGLILGGASLRTPVILDGVSAGAAALVARCVAPEALAACIAGHRSSEPGHVAALKKLGLRPLIDLDLRLGEGTGALLSLPMVQSAARAMHEVATFDSAGVTGKG